MNKARKIRLNSCIVLLKDAGTTMEEIKSEEEEARDNTPESLQESERYQVCEAACDALEEAIDLVQEIVDKLEEIEGVGA